MILKYGDNMTCHNNIILTIFYNTLAVEIKNKTIEIPKAN